MTDEQTGVGSVWRIDGVSTRARTIAEAAATSEGMALGHWIEQAIRDNAEPDLAHEVRKRLTESDERVTAIVNPLIDIVSDLADRVQRDRTAPTSGRGERGS